MLQRLFTLVIVIISILWIVVSYLPDVRANLPVIAFPLSNGWFALLSVLALILFVAVQLWLLYRTVNIVQRFQSNGMPFRLKVGIEFFWTALPIAMTLVLAWASYPLWLNTK